MMKKKLKINLCFVAALTMILSCTSSKTSSPNAVEEINTKPDKKGRELTVTFDKGSAFNHPLIAIWIENENGGFIQTLYVSKSFAKGIFKYGVSDGSSWKPGPRRRPATLPYYAHKLGIRTLDGLYLPTPENPVPDAVTGATPTGNFIVNATTEIKLRHFKVLLEINQPWDFNDSWTNNLFPNDDEYKTSGQPAVVYAATINTDSLTTVELKPIGHSSYNGQDGKLVNDLSSLTTALNIVEKATVTLKD
jgi:hypothetical protein